MLRTQPGEGPWGREETGEGVVPINWPARPEAGGGRSGAAPERILVFVSPRRTLRAPQLFADGFIWFLFEAGESQGEP